jgi:hypothetical protein
MNDLILYTTEDGRSQIKLRAKDETVRLSQREMSQLFDVSTDNVGLHLKNIFEDGELEASSVTEESSVTAADGISVVKHSLTTQLRLSRGATVKQFLTVQIDADLVATTEKSSVVQLPAEAKKQWRPCDG